MRQISLRTCLFWIHLITGLSVGLIIATLSITGMVLAFKADILSYTESHLRNIPSADVRESPLAISDILTQVQQAYPENKIQSITIKKDPSATLIITLDKPVGLRYIHPYTGQVLGGASAGAIFLKQVEGIHRWLGLQEGPLKPVGHQIKGVSTVVFIFLLLSGIYLWWPFKTLRLKKAALTPATYWNWHTVLGFWFAPLLLIITVSGIIMTYAWANNLLYIVTGSPIPSAKKERPAHDGVFPETIDSLIATSKTKTSEWVSLTIRASEKGKPIKVMIEMPAPGDMKWQSQLTMDSETGEQLKWEPTEALSSGRKARTWARYLHTGEAGGILGKTLAFLASAVGFILVITGLLLSWKRFSKKGN